MRTSIPKRSEAMTHEEFEARMQVFHIAMEIAASQLGGLAMGAAFNPDPKASATCAAAIPGVYDLAKSVLDDIRRDYESESMKRARGFDTNQQEKKR